MRSQLLPSCSMVSDDWRQYLGQPSQVAHLRNYVGADYIRLTQLENSLAKFTNSHVVAPPPGIDDMQRQSPVQHTQHSSQSSSSTTEQPRFQPRQPSVQDDLGLSYRMEARRRGTDLRNIADPPKRAAPWNERPKTACGTSRRQVGDRPNSTQVMYPSTRSHTKMFLSTPKASTAGFTSYTRMHGLGVHVKAGK